MIPPRPALAPVPPRGGPAVDRALHQAERAKERFDRELEGLILDLKEAQEAIRGDGDGRRDDERGA